jgi:hypothetical protein
MRADAGSLDLDAVLPSTIKYTMYVNYFYAFKLQFKCLGITISFHACRCRFSGFGCSIHPFS